jgi:excisionase family DNA binding protein
MNRPGEGSPLASGERLLSPEEVAGYLGVPVKTLFQWRYKGVGPRGLRVGRHLRYRAEDVEAWLERVGDPDRRGEVA